MLPAYMLRQIYAKGSLRNLKEGDSVIGFAFTIKNKLGTATLKGEVSVAVDGQAVALEAIELRKGDSVIKAIELAQTPVKFSVGDTVDIIVRKDGGLSAGTHKIDILVSTLEIGKAKFDITDTVVT